MIGGARLLKTLTGLAARTRTAWVGASAHANTRQVFRFAYQAIHQDLVREQIRVMVRVVEGRRVGVATTDTLEPKSLRRCAEAAREIARHSPTLETGAAPPADGLRLRTRIDHDRATARMSPAGCVARLRHLFHLCRGLGAELAGSLVTGEDEFAVATGSGAACYAASTVAGAKLVTMYGRLSGYASGVSRRFRTLSLEALLRRSLEQSVHQTDPVRLAPDTYEVILEPEAVAELLSWLGWTAFGAKALEEHSSFLAGRLGEKVMDRRITICDDGRHPALLRLPFDFEGVPRRRVPLVDRGCAAGVVYDTTYGDRFGMPSTGHAMPPDDTEGPLPLHLVMAPGRESVERMIRACRRGLLIPRFHYVNGLLNPREALMTGLTREGTFLIERGRLKSPVATLRFTQSILEAFRHVRGLSAARQLVAEPSQEVGCVLAPALHLAQFRFTSGSEA